MKCGREGNRKPEGEQPLAERNSHITHRYAKCSKIKINYLRGDGRAGKRMERVAHSLLCFWLCLTNGSLLVSLEPFKGDGVSRGKIWIGGDILLQ